MILLVIRHGESEADTLDVHEGRADFELTQKDIDRLLLWQNMLPGIIR